jgi:hypothetical protein
LGIGRIRNAMSFKAFFQAMESLGILLDSKNCCFSLDIEGGITPFNFPGPWNQMRIGTCPKGST